MFISGLLFGHMKVNEVYLLQKVRLDIWKWLRV